MSTTWPASCAPLCLLPQAEAYEEHFVLPDDRVVLLTSAGLLLVHAPGFAQLDGAAEIGGRVVVMEVVGSDNCGGGGSHLCD